MTKQDKMYVRRIVFMYCVTRLWLCACVCDSVVWGWWGGTAPTLVVKLHWMSTVV